MSEANGGPDGGSVEVGATDADLRWWLAKEAVRHGELLLPSQLSNLTAMETRATALFGWSVPTILDTRCSRAKYPIHRTGDCRCLVARGCGCSLRLWAMASGLESRWISS